MNRRAFIAALGSAAAGWPLVAWAQRAGVAVIGFLSSGRSDDFNDVVETYRKGLTESGFVEGQNVAIEYRWADGQYDRLPALVADLVHRPVTLIFTNGGLLPARAAKAATETIPIVFEVGTDPVRLGLVASLNRPGGNVTGVNYMQTQLAAKQLGLLRELLPRATRFAVLVNPKFPSVLPPQSPNCSKQPRPFRCKSKFSAPAKMTRSRRPSQLFHKCVSMRSW
jgi:putative ABC transport system substrate-binding protein